MVSALKRRYELTQSQKLMVFILSMSLYGISNMFSELIPELKLGPIELKVEYFAFIPLTLCVLFHPLYAAIGASFGEVIFGELLLGQFGGLGELEKFIEFSLAMYIGGLLVSDPRNRKQLALASFTAVGIDQLLSAIVDIAKVGFGIEELEAVPGIPESIVLIEGLSFLNAMVITGIFFTLLPTLYLVPRLYGKIEPLLGLKPRDSRIKASFSQLMTPRLLIVSILFVFIGMAGEFLSESDINFAVWEPEFLEQYGSGFMWVSVGAALLVLIITILAAVRKRTMAKSVEDAKL
ncbi:cell division protein FtsQ [Paenibacillus sp. NEAU-GSW1]|uniref:cell division protein FtsQ n=1 Tax=Paenibacillus sp. NEAU-GSW1 TaxID=2682486 RepID=UPI0012E24674|nr:cell division protein FtsQ [Paenibacillus sp. NEAU-GSW1]MUT67934.1 cell division protein FtsQ [Paenibacillus sp. NEAU-GSW1]